jgi:hypothetical protein
MMAAASARSLLEERNRTAQIARDLADPRFTKIKVYHTNVGARKWWAGVIIDDLRGKAATHGASESSQLVLYEDGELRVEDLNEISWEFNDFVEPQLPTTGMVIDVLHTSGKFWRTGE